MFGGLDHPAHAHAHAHVQEGQGSHTAFVFDAGTKGRNVTILSPTCIKGDSNAFKRCSSQRMLPAVRRGKHAVTFVFNRAGMSAGDSLGSRNIAGFVGPGHSEWGGSVRKSGVQ